jgi:DNA replication protein DnaC
MEGSVRTIGNLFDPEGFLVLSKKIHRERIERLHSQGVDLSMTLRSSVKLSKLVTDCFLEILPPELDVNTFICGCSDELAAESHERLVLCAKCKNPDTPFAALCDDMQHEGEEPFWNPTRVPGGNGVDWRECKRWRPFTLDRRMQKWGFPRRLMRCTVAEIVETTEQVANLKRFVAGYIENFAKLERDGKGLRMFGSPGTGKTHMSVAACRRLLETKQIRTAQFWDLTSMLTRLRIADDAERRELLRQATEAAVLVLDDIGAQKTTEWVIEQLGMVINDRWSNGRPVIVTSNQSVAEMNSRLGERISSRLMECTIAIHVEGPDYRAAKAHE